MVTALWQTYKFYGINDLIRYINSQNMYNLRGDFDEKLSLFPLYFSHSAVESRFAHATLFENFCFIQSFIVPLLYKLGKISGYALHGTPEAYAFCFRGGYSLTLTLLYVIALTMRHNERIYKTKSLMKVPIRSRCKRVSSKGKSITTISVPFSFVSIRH